MDMVVETSTSLLVATYKPYAKLQTHAVTIPTINLEILKNVTIVPKSCPTERFEGIVY